MNKWGSLKLGLLAVGIAVGIAPVSGMAAPKASTTGRSWQLDFRFHDPQRISIVLPGDQAPTTFWYLLYEVTNNTGRDVEYYPSFELVTNTLQTVTGGDNISPSVYEAIAAQHRKEYPFFATPFKVTGTLLQGEINHRVSAAVFRDFDRSAHEFTVFTAGLSGEMKRIPNPTRAQNKDNPAYYVLRRSLAVTYGLPGDSTTRKSAKPVRKRRDWVMR